MHQEDAQMVKAKMEKLQGARMARQALDRTARLVDAYGSRLVGSEACQQTARDLHEELSNYTDRAEQESFVVHPAAFLGWIRMLVVIYPVALLLLWVDLPLVALILNATGMAVMVFEFFLYKEVVDRLYPAKTGVNVHGVIEPAGEVHQTVVFSGHHDSAQVFNFFTNKPSLYMLRIGSGLGFYLAFLLVALMRTFNAVSGDGLFSVSLPPAGYLVATILLTVGVPFVGHLWFFASSEGTPGAGDNLISSAMAIELASYFHSAKTAGVPLKHTRLVLASFDGEEAGLRGARAFFARHAGDFAGKPLWNFNVDCPYDAKDLFFLTSDINGSVKLSQKMATECVNVAHSMGYEAFSQPIAFLTGGTDAAEAAKAGFHAVTLMAMPWGNKERNAVYHTPADLPEAIDPKAVEETISIAIRFIEKIDSGEIKD